VPHNIGLLLTLAGGLVAALLLGALTQRLKLSPIVGYLLAGVAVGPFTPGIEVDRHLAEQLAEVGVVLLMFGVGLHFHAKDLLAVRRIAVPGAIFQIGIATGLGVLVTSLFGWSLVAGLVFGVAISVASTVVLVRVLSDHDALHTPAGHVAVGWLLVEDLFTVMVLVLLPVVATAGDGADPARIAIAVGVSLAKVGALVAFTFTIGKRAIPALLRWAARTRSRELFTLAVLAIALGIAVGSAQLFDASLALGAFLAGMIVGQSEFSARAMSDALPMRDAFAVLFFVAMGMLLDPFTLVENAPAIAATLAVILIGKPLAALALAKLLRYPTQLALPVAVALAQIGEFSFIVAALGLELGILPQPAMQILVACSMASITLSPLLMRGVAPLTRKLRATPREVGQPEPGGASRAVVVGYGPVGRTLVRLLKEQGIEPTVIELNHETVERLRADGVHAVYGDASRPEVLEHAGVKDAVSLVFAASGPPAEVVSAARDLRPELPVIARATYLADSPAVERAGATSTVIAELEVALAMTERVMTILGASPAQLDRARERVYEELADDRPLRSELSRARG
jgi:CPA2 family monovalent cation:H+ antiporter-2